MQNTVATAGSPDTTLGRELRALAELVDQAAAAGLEVGAFVDRITLADAMTSADELLRGAIAALAYGIRMPLSVHAGPAIHEAESLAEAVATVAEVAADRMPQPVVILDAIGVDVTGQVFTALCGRAAVEVQP